MAVEPVMMPMSVDEIATAVNGRLVVSAGSVATAETVAVDVASDSRQVHDGTVFVAIAGERVDGHDFVEGAARSGAVAALVCHEVEAPIVQIVVPDTVAALGDLARHNISRRRAENTPFTIVGITGSVGKTTTKDMLSVLLGDMGATVAPVGSFNNEIGLPLTALNVGRNTRFLVAEMGANHVGEIARLTTIAPPDIAVVLKVGVAHLGEFGSVDRIVEAKSEIIRGLRGHGTAILNADDAHVTTMAELAPDDVLWFGMESERALDGGCSARDVDVDGLDRPRFTLMTPDGDSTPVQLGICGRHNVMNALAAASVAYRLGMDPKRIGAVLEGVSRISPHRMAVSTVERHGGVFTLIDDSFNANPDSMRAGLDGLKTWNGDGQSAPYRVAVLGAMLELGEDDVALHRSIGEYAAGCGLDAIVAVGSTKDAHFDALAEAVADGAKRAIGGNSSTHPSIDWVHDTDQADAVVTRLACDHGNTVVLLKGSHFSGLSVLAEQWTA